MSTDMLGQAIWVVVLVGCASRQMPVVAPTQPATSAAVEQPPPPATLPPVAISTAGSTAPGLRVQVSNQPMAAATIDTTALGSHVIPVTSNGPSGEREYLRRLLCADGKAPGYVRNGSAGSGRDGHILDIYTLTCAGGATTRVYMDMYHADREMRPITSFTILPEIPEKLATGCPPQITSNADSNAKRIFTYQELGKPAEPLVPIPNPVTGQNVTGSQQLSFIIDTLGIPDTATVTAGAIGRPELLAVAKKVVAEMRFTPPQHHEGCLVKQRLGITLVFK